MKIDGTYYMRSLFGNLVTAMEADGQPEDITATTNDMMKRASGSRADTGELNPSRTSEETQQENGGNIDRDAMSDNTDGLDPNPPEDDGAMPPEDDGMGGDMGELGGEGDDMGGGNEPTADDTSTPAESPEQGQRILKLQKNMFTFYRILCNTMETVNDYTAPASTPELRKIFNAAIDHLSSAKDMLYELVSTDFTPDNYPTKLRKYIALRHVYSAVIEMLQLHFQILDSQSGSSKTSSGK